MTGLSGPLVLTVALGGAVGLIVRRAFAAPRPGVAPAVAAGAAGGVAAGFLLPQTGLPVSRSLSMGLAVTVAGALLAVIAVRSALRFQAPQEARLRTFRALTLLGAALCLLDAGLVLASLALAPRFPGPVAVSAAVAIGFGAVAALLAQLRRHLSDAVGAVSRDPTLSDAEISLRRVLGVTILGALWLDAILLLVAVAFVDRMRQGSAIFG